MAFRGRRTSLTTLEREGVGGFVMRGGALTSPEVPGIVVALHDPPDDPRLLLLSRTSGGRLSTRGLKSLG